MHAVELKWSGRLKQNHGSVRRSSIKRRLYGHSPQGGGNGCEGWSAAGDLLAGWSCGEASATEDDLSSSDAWWCVSCCCCSWCCCQNRECQRLLQMVLNSSLITSLHRTIIELKCHVIPATVIVLRRHQSLVSMFLSRHSLSYQWLPTSDRLAVHRY